MARQRKTTVIDANSVNITDFCTSQGLNEQIFRLELMQYQDDADSAKSVDFDVAGAVASIITAKKPSLPETAQTSENLKTQEFQPATETATEPPLKPQNNAIVGGTPNSLNSPARSSDGAKLPALLDELIQESEDVIDLADLVHRYRNEQIIENARTRDSELVVQLRERRVETRNQVFDSLRSLNARQPVRPDLPELPSNLKDEIKSLSDEMGKKLSA